MFHYSGAKLAAVRYRDHKVVIKGNKGGLPDMSFFNVRRDPGEKYGPLYDGLWAVTPLQNLMRSHMGRIQQFPHRSPEVREEARMTPHD